MTETATEPETPETPQVPVEVRDDTIIAATFDALQKKRRRRDEAFIPTYVDDRPVKLRVKMEAIGSTEYDALLNAHKPTVKQRDEGMIVNPDTFNPALLEKVVVEPKLSYQQWKQLLEDPNWSGGEVGGLIGTAQRLCQGGLDIPFSVSD